MKSVLVTAMGFLLGMVLAGVGGLPAKAFLLNWSKKESNLQTEKFWSNTGLGHTDVVALISNSKCNSNLSYYQACALALAPLELNQNNNILGLNIANASDENITEKQLAQALTQNNTQIDFNKTLKKFFSEEEEAKKSILAGRIINSFLSAYLDPHTYILPSEYYEQVSSKLERSPLFVGFAFEKREGQFYILKIAKNSDADKAGLKAEDQVVSINDIELKNLKYSDVSQILRDEKTKAFKFEIRRERKKLSLAFARSFRSLSHVQFNFIDEQNKIGLITLSKFSRGACSEVAKILNSHADLQGLVFDMRDNSGGHLNETACLQGLFLGKNKKAYYVEYFDESMPNEVVLTSENQIYSGPLIVLINNQSASAAETLSGAFQDYQRALLIGRRTFGKGTFQEPEVWMQNSQFNLFKTQGFYLLPSRNATQLVGVKPDIEMPTKGFEKREDSIYFKPIKNSNARYAGLKKSELVPNQISQNCINKNVNNKSVGAVDMYLEKSLSVLHCNIEVKNRLAQMGNKTLN